MRRFVVVTPVLNGRRFIADTLLSIDRQSWPEWIHVVVDGGSTDGTIELARQSCAAEPRRRLIAGTDRGIYDAVFKGFAAISPQADDILLWLNADDMLSPWAFVTAAAAFDAGADWVTGLPGHWDAAGRLTYVNAATWYPQRFIRAGLFHSRLFGWIQQESTFFSRRLLDRADPTVLDRIRGLKLAGDFVLWRELARHAPLVTLPALLGGFRLHGGNASMAVEKYFQELKAERVWVPPKAVGAAMRVVFRVLALFATAARARRAARDVLSRLPV
jgi:glycosyltransferase involved in cell wall biosynthesis